MKKEVKFYPLVFAENYYIHENGYVFYIKNSIQLMPMIKNNDIVIAINNVNYNLFNLMVEYFINERTFNYVYSTDKIHPLRIPLRLIKKEKELVIVKNSNLNNRVNSANARAVDKINVDDINFIIKKYLNKCSYCNTDLRKKQWHLDHIHPLSKGGKNKIDNLTLACKTCNLMKNSMIKKDFIEKCISIVKNEQNNTDQ